jgi:hypothetical protein
MRNRALSFSVLLGLLVACSSTSGSSTSSSGGTSGGSSSGASGGSSGTVGDGGHPCATVADCPVNPGAACVKNCPDGTSPCATVCVNGQCGVRGCP